MTSKFNVILKYSKVRASRYTLNLSLQYLPSKCNCVNDGQFFSYSRYGNTDIRRRLKTQFRDYPISFVRYFGSLWYVNNPGMRRSRRRLNVAVLATNTVFGIFLLNVLNYFLALKQLVWELKINLITAGYNGILAVVDDSVGSFEPSPEPDHRNIFKFV